MSGQKAEFERQVRLSDPAEKYRDKVSPSHVAAIQAIGLMRTMLNQHRESFEKLIKAEQDMHSFGGMLDPTLYRDMLNSKSFVQQMKLVKAAIKFLDASNEVAAQLGELDPTANAN